MASYAYTFTSGDTVTPTKLNNARTVSEIVNADIKSDAAIALSKLATGALPTGITVASANLVDGTIVNADINAAAAIDLSKLATGALPSAITVASANLVDGTIVNADINASAAIADAKLATISTAGKVSNSATTATNANTANAIVARDASGGFLCGAISCSSNITSSGDITASGGLIGSVSDGSSIVRSSRASTDASGPQIDFRKSRGTQAAQTMVADGDIVGEVRFVAYDGASDREAARIRATVDGTPASADMPARLQFYTTADGAGNVTERMRITNAGVVAIGTTSPNAAAQLDVTSTTRGFLPPRMTTAQRDAIATPPAGLMVYNTTTNKLNFYNGTAWEAVTSA